MIEKMTKDMANDIVPEDNSDTEEEELRKINIKAKAIATNLEKLISGICISKMAADSTE